MRKYIVGAIAGFFLATAVSAHAEVVNVIGKVVDGAFSVNVNGAKLVNQALVIEGTSYLPVREFGESLGMDVSFDANMGISLTQKPTPAPTESPEQQAQREKTAKYQDLQTQSDALTKEIAELQKILIPYEYYANATIKPKDDTYTQAKAKYEELTKQRDSIDQQLKDMRNQS